MKPPRDVVDVWPDGECVYSMHFDEAGVRALAAGIVSAAVRENAQGMLDLAAKHTIAVPEKPKRKKSA